MRDIVCRHCNATVQVPDDLAQAHCVRCGQPLALLETHFTAAPAPSQAIQPIPEAEWTPTHSGKPFEASTEPYTNWEDFRSNSATVQRELIELATRPLPDLRQGELKPLPENTPDKADAFGRPIASITFTGENRLLTQSLTIGLFLFSGGCAWLAMATFAEDHRRGDPKDAFAMGFTALSAFVFAVVLQFLRHPYWPVTYWVAEGGMVWQKGGEIEAFTWEEIRAVEVIRETGAVWLKFQFGENRKAYFSSQRNRLVIPWAEFIEVKVTAAQFLPQLRRIFAGERVRFGIVELDRTAFISHAGATSPEFHASWDEITQVASDRTHLFVNCHNRPTWHAIPYCEVTFPLLVIAISHIIKTEEKRLPRLGA